MSSPCVQLDGEIDSGWLFYWSSNKGFFSQNLKPKVCEAATYFLHAEKDSQILFDTVLVTIDTIAIEAQAGEDKKVGCLFDEVILDIKNPGVGFSVFVQGPQNFKSNTLPVKVKTPGIYLVEVFKGHCNRIDTVVVKKDFTIKKPNAGKDLLINCNTPNAMLLPEKPEKEVIFEWLYEGQKFSSKLNPIIDKEGIYVFKTTKGQCSNADTIIVSGDFRKPEIMGVNSYQLPCLPPFCVKSKIVAKYPNESIFTWTDFKNSAIATSLNTIFCETGKFKIRSRMPANGCIAEMDIEVKNADSLRLEVSTTPTCNDLNKGIIEVLNVKNGTSPYTFSIDNIKFQSDKIFDSLQINTYRVFVKDSKGCKGSLITKIDQQALLTWDLESEYTFCSHDQPLELDVTIPNNTKSTQYVWSDGVSSPKRLFTSTGKYWVKVKNECFEEYKDIYVKDDFDEIRNASLYAPNVFNIMSVNDDNKTYKTFLNFPILDFQLRIFDRNGNMIFETNDSNASWDGTYKGKKLKDDVFVWQVRASLNACGHPIPYENSGSVQLLKN